MHFRSNEERCDDNDDSIFVIRTYDVTDKKNF
jgi:hypothetical protein